MYYVEFFRKRDGVPIEEFHREVRQSYSQWQQDHPQDELVLLIGRTWRLGPRPSYICVWKIRDLARIDEWRRDMPGPDVMDRTVQIIEDAGVYEDLGQEQL